MKTNMKRKVVLAFVGVALVTGINAVGSGTANATTLNLNTAYYASAAADTGSTGGGTIEKQVCHTIPITEPWYNCAFILPYMTGPYGCYTHRVCTF